MFQSQINTDIRISVHKEPLYNDHKNITPVIGLNFP